MAERVRSYRVFVLGLLVVLLTGVIAYGAAYGVGRQHAERSVRIRFGTQELRVDTATTLAEQAHGLSGRASIGADEGLLFIFNRDGYYPFWMNDMRFPIDIIWISAGQRVVGVSAYVLPESFPVTYSPPQPVRYVVETNAGWALRHHINVGTPMNVTDSTPVLY